MDALSPGTMRLLRKIADQNGSTIEEVMAAAMEEFVVGRKERRSWKRRLSDFRNAKRTFADSRFIKNYGGVDLISDRLPFA